MDKPGPAWHWSVEVALLMLGLMSFVGTYSDANMHIGIGTELAAYAIVTPVAAAVRARRIDKNIDKAAWNKWNINVRIAVLLWGMSLITETYGYEEQSWLTDALFCLQMVVGVLYALKIPDFVDDLLWILGGIYDRVMDRGAATNKK